MVRVYKDPQDVIYLGFDGTAWLDDGEVFSDQTITAPAGLTLAEEAITNDGTAVVAKVSGGTLHEQYSVPYLMTTNQGRVKKKTIIIQLRNE